MRNDCFGRLIATFMGGVFYLGHASLACAQAQGAANSSVSPPSTKLADPSADSYLAANRRRWQTVLKLIARVNPEISAEDFERHFQPYHIVRSKDGRNELQDVIFSDDVGFGSFPDASTKNKPPSKIISGFSFSFGYSGAPDKCYEVDRAINDIRGSGWVLREHHPAGPMPIRIDQPPDTPVAKDIFIKGDRTVVTLSYFESPKCAVRVSIDQNSSELDEINHQRSYPDGM